MILYAVGTGIKNGTVIGFIIYYLVHGDTLGLWVFIPLIIGFIIQMLALFLNRPSKRLLKYSGRPTIFSEN